MKKYIRHLLAALVVFFGILVCLESAREPVYAFIVKIELPEDVIAELIYVKSFLRAKGYRVDATHVNLDEKRYRGLIASKSSGFLKVRSDIQDLINSACKRGFGWPKHFVFSDPWGYWLFEQQYKQCISDSYIEKFYMEEKINFFSLSPIIIFIIFGFYSIIVARLTK